MPAKKAPAKPPAKKGNPFAKGGALNKGKPVTCPKCGNKFTA